MFIRFIRHFLIALQFFTRIPITGRLANWVGFSPVMLRASAAHLPAVGWVVGGLTAVVLAFAWGSLPKLATSAWVAAVISTVFSVWLTGGFHEDGLADTADGLGGGLTQARALDIMKDSRLGSYGVLALLLALLAKLSLLASLLELNVVWAVAGVFAAHVTSRLAPLFLMRTMHHVGDVAQSKSKPLADGMGNAGLCVGVLWWLLAMLGVVYAVPSLPLWAGACGAVFFMGYMAWSCQKKLGGFTGDILGATQQLAEIGFYLGLVLAAGSV